MKNQLSCLPALLLLACAPVFSQQKITGRVTDAGGQPLSFASVLLYRLPDSVFVKGQMSDEAGSYTFETLPPGNYWVRASFVGRENAESQVFSISEKSGAQPLATLVLDERKTLSTVEVRAKKPLFEQKMDRLVVNVENSVTSAGNTALEVLERSPGVMVNRQSSTISIAGKSGVVVMVNGKISYMSAEAAVSFLQGLSAANVEKIEIMSTPPSNLDAEGNAGYVNVVLKKNQNEGLNGSYAATLGYGGRGEMGNASVNFTWRKGKTALFGDYAYLRKGQINPMLFYREIDQNGVQVAVESDSDRRPTRQNNTLRFGMDYQLTPKTVLGGLVSSYDHRWEMLADNRSTISKNGTPDTLILTATEETNHWNHLGGNLNLTHDFSKKSNLSFDADYLFYYDDNPIDYTIEYQKPGSGAALRNEIARSSKVTPIRIAVAKADYKVEISRWVKMSAGLKGVVSNFGNDVAVQFLKNQIWESDAELTGNYELDEKIAAAYADFEWQINPKTSAKTGLRYEHTDTHLGSEEQPDIVDRNYGRLFPALFVQHNFSEKQAVNFSYSRRITRPQFNELAPFVIFIDPNSYFSGNAALQPALSHNLKLDYRLKTTLFSLAFSHEDSTIARFQPTVETASNKQYSRSANLKFQKTASLTIGRPYSPTKWWNMYVNAAAVWTRVGIWDAGRLSVFEAPYATFFSSQNFTLAPSLTLELSGFFNSGGFFGASRNRPFGAANVGLQKKFPRRGSALTLGYDNFLNTMIFRSTLDFPEAGQFFRSRLQFDFPVVKLTFSQRFGSEQVKARRRAVGSEEERKRVE